jgi:four helix bundle protein
MKIDRFEDIVAWQRARSLVTGIYRAVNAGQARRDFPYRDQLCRAAVSAMTNVAEGFARRSKVEFARYLDIARASAREVQSLLHVGHDLRYFSDADFDQLYSDANATAFLIGRLMASMKN